jgi:hypothetical protein
MYVTCLVNKLLQYNTMQMNDLKRICNLKLLNHADDGFRPSIDADRRRQAASTQPSTRRTGLHHLLQIKGRGLVLASTRTEQVNKQF